MVSNPSFFLCVVSLHPNPQEATVLFVRILDISELALELLFCMSSHRALGVLSPIDFVGQ